MSTTPSTAAGGELDFELELEDAQDEAGEAPAPQATDPVPASAPAAPEDDSEIDLNAVDPALRPRIQRLMEQRQNELMARQRAEQERMRTEQALQEARAEQVRLQGQTERLDLAVVQQHKERIEAQQARIQAEMADAISSGDPKAQMEATQKAARLAIEAERVRLAEARLAQQPAQPAQPAPPAQPARQAPDPKAQAWAARNTWFGEDPVLTASAYGVHTQLVNEGVAPDSDRYYQELDRRMKPIMDATRGKPQAPARPALAAGASSASLAPPGGKRKIILTAAQQATAKALGVSFEDYARELVRLQKEA
jgi:hypothetical protein